MTLFAPYLVIATHLNFLTCIFGYTDRLPLNWYQIYVNSVVGTGWPAVESMFLMFFMIPVLTTCKKTFLDCQTYIVIIQGERFSISKFQELIHTVLSPFIIMPLQTGIGCLMK